MSVVQQERANASSSATASDQKSSSGGGAGDARRALRGMSFDDQSAALAPGGAVQKKEAQGATAMGKGVAEAAAKKGAEVAAKKDGGKKEESRSFGATDPGGRMAALHPTFADYVRRVIDIAHGKGLDIFIAQGMRTIAEQNELYKQGRTKKGKVVTWVRGGSSYHNYGLAVDFAFHGKSPYAESHDWAGLVASVREAGLVSGASYGDRPHGNMDVPMKSLQGWYAKGGMRNVWDHVSEDYGGPRYPGDDGGEEQQTETQGPKSGGGGAGGYTVRPGDTLIDIAERLLGDGARWGDLAAANGIKDPRDLAPGKVLKIPTGPSKQKKDDGDHMGERFHASSHTVGPGETLTAIALKYYGMSSLWTEIAMANQVKDPSALRVGQRLTIPTPSDKAKSTPPPKAIPMSHVVAPGETLSAIAAKHLGDAARWKEIASANHIADPRALKVGTTLTIPVK